MKRVIQNIFICMLVFIIGFVLGLLVQCKRSEQKKHTDILDMGFQKQTLSEITAQYTYTRENGADPIDYYCIKTTYYEADPKKVTGLNTNAFHTVFDPETAETSKEMMIQDWYGCLYTLSEKSYLCWTVTPYTSYILEYDPVTVSDADILRMAESVK